MMTKMEKRSRVASIVDQWPLGWRTRTIAEHNTGLGGGQKLSEVYESAQSTKEGRRIVVTLKYAARTIHTEICPSSFGLPSFLPSFLPPFGFSTPFLYSLSHFYFILFFWIQLHHKSFSSQLCEVKRRVEGHPQEDLATFGYRSQSLKDHPQEDLATFGYRSQSLKDHPQEDLATFGYRSQSLKDHPQEDLATFGYRSQRTFYLV